MAITNAELKKLVQRGIARDITKANVTKTMQKNIKTVLTVPGPYGMNGALLASKSGRLDVIIGRASNLFAFD